MKKQFEAAPLPSTFMLTAILGFLISSIYVADLSLKFGFAFSLVFMIMFIASIISMTKSEADDEYLDHLAVHEPDKHLKHLK